MNTIINSFPGYEYIYDEKDKQWRNMYRGTDVGKGGYVYSEPGIYGNVALLDVASQHPHSIIALNYFGEYTPRFKELIDVRIAIKHRDFDTARKMFNGRLARYLTDEDSADMLSKALKLPINGSYGLTAASFDNPMRDPRNNNNIIALRGALFMRTLQDEVQERGFTVAHIKTDSIKIPDATPEIIQFVMEFGKRYGYTFEHEATYEKMCLVNDAVYVAKYATKEKCENIYGYIPGDNKKHSNEWTATGTQFQVPYVFKTLFSKEPIEFSDMCETKSVSSSLYLDMNEDLSDLPFKENGEPNTEEDMHNYRFIGKVGSFCPIKPGCGGGLLMREKDGKYYAATGSKGYRWLESEVVQTLGKEADIDREYYNNLVDDAIATISEYGDFEWFASDEPYIAPPFVGRQDFMNPPEPWYEGDLGLPFN